MQKLEVKKASNTFMLDELCSVLNYRLGVLINIKNI